MTLSLYCHDRQRHGYFQRSRRRSPAWAPPKPRPPRSVGPHFPLPCPIVFSFFRFFVLVGWLAVKVQMMLFTRMLQCLVFHSILLACQSALWSHPCMGMAVISSSPWSHAISHKDPEELAPPRVHTPPPSPCPLPSPIGSHVGLSIICPGSRGHLKVLHSDVGFDILLKTQSEFHSFYT